MFSYLRPHHKRTTSNPSSPAEHTFEPPLHPNLPLDHGHPQRSQDADPRGSLLLPSLPQVTRVSSADLRTESSRGWGYENESMNQYADSSRHNSNSRPIESRAYSSVQGTWSYGGGSLRPDSMQPNQVSLQHTRPPVGPTQDRSTFTGPSQKFVTAADLQSRPVQNGRRPIGARLPTPPPAGNQSSTFEPVQPRSAKTRLNLLNPMSLLARRRTSQAVPQLQPEALVSPRHDTYDFQIKGNRVHDFSAPRAPKRNVSYNDVKALEKDASTQYQQSPNSLSVHTGAADETPTSPWSGGNHTPVFTENFEEEQYPAAGPHVRKANDFTDLDLPRPPYAQGSRKPEGSKPESKGVEASNKNGHTRKLSDRKPLPNSEFTVPPRAEVDVPAEPRRISIDPASTPPKPSPSSKKGRSRNVSEVSIKDGLPRHMKSTSSRFSFDMIGAAEQERLLEDRHRQRALEKKNENLEDEGGNEFDDDFDYDDMMDDDGLEERIPGVNAELEEEEEDFDVGGGFEEPIPGVNTDAEEYHDEEIPDYQHLGGFTFQQPSAPMSPYSPVANTPRDANGEVIGFAMTKESPFFPRANDHDHPSNEQAPKKSEQRTLGTDQDLHGLGLKGFGVPQSSRADAELNLQDISHNDRRHTEDLDDDDLYFDDGIIGGPEDLEDGPVFDESVFDNNDTDEYGRPIKSLSSLPTLYSPPNFTVEPSPGFNNLNDIAKEDVQSPATSTDISGPRPSVTFGSNPITQRKGLTQDSLAAYQSALAAAAHQAAAAGKFRRDSTSTFHPQEEQQEAAQPSLVPDSTRTSHHDAFSPSYEIEDDFDYDDAMDDDAIIAAANAEALASDSDGFYGQEFGFYSAPLGEGEYANGGYFGPRGVEGINRSTSGRIVREPNLTPITERSEYSNRNSFMGLSMNRPESMTAPGLTQLAGMMRIEDYEGDLSLDALLKLRRGAWGGSQASLHSSAGSPRSANLEEGSPIGSLPPWSTGSQTFSPVGPTGYMRRNSGFSGASIVSEGSLNPGNVYARRNSIGMAMEIGPKSENSSSPASPVLYKAPLNSTLEPISAIPEGNGSEGHTSPVKEEKELAKDKSKRHRYTGSAESISYRKEEDPISGDRWILERRRTAESGEIEVLGTEVVSGGRI